LVKVLNQINLNSRSGIFQNSIQRLNEGIYNFNETNLNFDLELGFKGKEN
jgi:hypothetical protein